MPTIDEVMNTPVNEPIGNPGMPTEETIQESSGGLGVDLSFLKAETGDGSIEDYIDHPLNFSKNRGLAQMIRGLTGMFGQLRFAVLDVMIGFVEWRRTKGVVQNVNTDYSGVRM